MLNLIKKTELEYIKEFTTNTENDEVILFTDTRLPGMDHHNFTYIKEGIKKEKLKETVNKDIKRRYEGKHSSAFFISDFKIDEELFKDLPYEVTYHSFDYMYVNTSEYENLNSRSDFSVKAADSEEVLSDGVNIDIVANKKYMGDFAAIRIKRKAEIYTDKELKTNLYVGYHDDVCIGNCELFITDKIAKLEDFDIAEPYQKKGFGTSFLKHLLSLTHDSNVETLYIVTDSDDTAKDMYTKCNFKKIGTKYEVYIDFNKKINVTE